MLRILGLLVLSTLCSTASAGDPIVVDKWRPPYANMENLPPGFFAKSVNDSCMTAWNASVDLFRQFGSDGFWGANGVSEFAGFAPDADLASTYGFHYGSALALTIVSYDLGSNQITESDVCVNPAYQWTSSALAAEFSPTQYYLPAVMMHELGHALGVQTTAESYTYDVPSVMHALYPHVAAPASSPHAHDAKILRAAYSGIATVPTTKDAAVFAHRVVAGKLANSGLSAFVVPQGGAVVAKGVTIENVGNVDLTNLRVRLWLSKSQLSPSGAVLIGDWTFATFPKETAGTYDFAGQLPASIAPGSWAVVVELTTPGDANASNDVAHLKEWLTVTAGPNADDAFEPNDGPQTATPRSAGTTSGLVLAASDEDWFSIELVAGQRLEAGILFAHAAGNLELQLFDPALNLVVGSTSADDDEWCVVDAASESGPWFVRVFGAPNGYALALNVSTPAGSGGGGVTSFTPGDRLTGQLGAGTPALEAAFAAIPGMKLQLVVTTPKALSARVNVLAPDGSTVKLFSIKPGSKTKRTVKLAAAGTHRLRFEHVAGGGSFEAKTARSLPKAAKVAKATFTSNAVGGFAQKSFLALPGTLLDVQVTALGSTPDTLVKQLVRPDATMQDVTFDVDVDGLSLVDVPLALAGSWTFRLSAFPQKGQKAKVRIEPTPPAAGTSVVVLQ